jgi:hypothetical protein
MKLRIIIVFLLLACTITVLSGQEQEQDAERLMLFLPVSYDLLRLEKQTLHNPGGGLGFILGEQDQPFDKIERQFFGIALYQPFFFTQELSSDLPKQLHQIKAIFDGRIKRHQLLAILKSSSDNPFSGLNTFRAGVGWGYEVIHKPQVSLILGGLVGVSDFGFDLPSGDPLPVMPLPLIRFGIDTQWISASFEYLTGPYLDFTIAPKERIRFTADMSMENFRSIADLVCEYTLWYRLVALDNKLGDFAGIGVGFKNDLKSFDLSRDKAERRPETFELQQSSVFAVIDLSFLKIQGGYIIDSNYLIDGKKQSALAKVSFFQFKA